MPPRAKRASHTALGRGREAIGSISAALSVLPEKRNGKSNLDYDSSGIVEGAKRERV